MAKLRRLSERHQITLPPELLEEAGFTEGTLVSIVAEKGRLILEPKKLADDDLAKEDWDALDALVRRQVSRGEYADYASPSEAKAHLKKRRS